MIRQRGGWLVILFLGEMLTATAMGFFEREIERAVVLALFVPLIISSGGNSGSQAATLVIRALALGEVGLARVVAGHVPGDPRGAHPRRHPRHHRLLAHRGLVGGADIYGPHWVLVALTVGLSLVGVVLWGTLAGSMLPFVLRRLGFDPAAPPRPSWRRWST